MTSPFDVTSWSDWLALGEGLLIGTVLVVCAWTIGKALDRRWRKR